MPEGLLRDTLVVDLAGEPAALAGRVLADLGASVTRVEPPGGDPLRTEVPHRARAWHAGTTSVTVAGPDDPALTALLDRTDVVIDTPGFPGSWELDPGRAPRAVWVRVTPFGADGPRAGWRASDLGVMAASGNMYCTGHPDRAPLRCSEPSGYAHVGPEAAFAALSGLASGRPQLVDVSMQEAVVAANMAAPASVPETGYRGGRRGAQIGRTREIWPCRDGWVSFGLRGGKARVPSLETLTRLVVADGIAAPALTDHDWRDFSHTEASDAELAAIEEPVAAYFARHTMQELYDLACETNLMLAPACSPREILDSAQLAARGFFGPYDEVARLPQAFVTVRSVDGEAAPAGPAPHPGNPGEEPGASPGRGTARPATGPRAWEGVRILELGAGAAGPIATRYFAEQGATVLRVESRGRPDFLRVYALGPGNEHGLEGSRMFDGLNVGKLGTSLNLKHPDGVALLRRLVVEWADAVAENYAPRAMKGFGVDYDALAALKPDLVMVSACLNGQTGPHRDYPGFGGQGAALSGFNWLTGWPDREPVGPYATITDSLAPRYVATALAAGLLYRRRTGRGAYLDLSQVETGVYSLAPWLLEYQLDGVTGIRVGNRDRSGRAVPHGAFRCRGDDRWLALACWNDDEWRVLADILGIEACFPMRAERHAHEDEVEALVAAATAERDAVELAELLQAHGIEAVPVQDFADVFADPQLAHREHFAALTHPVLGERCYERTGFRLRAAPAGYERSGPTLGQDDEWVQRELLALDGAERARLQAAGAFD